MRREAVGQEGLIRRAHRAQVSVTSLITSRMMWSPPCSGECDVADDVTDDATLYHYFVCAHRHVKDDNVCAREEIFGSPGLAPF